MMEKNSLSSTASRLFLSVLLTSIAALTPLSALYAAGASKHERARPFTDSTTAVHPAAAAMNGERERESLFSRGINNPKEPADTVAWTPANSGLGSYYIYGVARSASGDIFAGTGAGLYASTNTGSTWSYYGLSSYEVDAVLVSSSGTVFAGTSSGLRFTTNGGSSWWYVLTDYRVNAVTVGPSGYIYAGTNEGVWYSYDGGSNFYQLGLSDRTVWSLAVNSNEYVFAGTDAGVYFSTNLGSTWYYALSSYAIYSLSINSSGTVFAGAGSGAGMYNSTNNGNNWSSCGMSGYSVFSACLTPTDDIVAGSTGGVYLSTDGGSNWSYLGSSGGHTAWGINSYGGYIFAGTSGYGMYRARLGPPAPALAYPGGGASGVATSLIFDWTESQGASSYRIQVSLLSSFSSTVYDESGITNTARIIYGFLRSTTYYWRVSASNSTGTSDWSPTRSFTTFSYPSSVSLSRDYYVPANLDSTGYRIFGVPGGDDISLSDVFSGNEGPDWTAYYDNGSSGDYLVEYDGSSTFHFRPGAAFWILSKNAFSISRTSSPAALNNYDSYQIPLHSGWNLISDPFEISIPWLTVQAWNLATSSWTLQPIWSFNGSYSQATTLDPFGGYYFYNDAGASSIEVPYGKNIQAFAKSSQGSIPAARKTLRRCMLPADAGAALKTEKIVVSLSGDSRAESSVTVGFNGLSGGASRNVLAPPGDFEATRICVVDNAVPTAWKELLEVYRDSIGAGQQVGFYVKNKAHRNLSIQLNVDQTLANYEVFILDRDLRRSYDVKMSNRIEIPSFNVMKHYSLLIGSRAFVDKALAGLIPKTFKLSQNYPNPFNPATVIRFQIPETGHVSLVVYDILGRKVGTLMNAVVQPGYYELPFDGTRLSSGVYFYRLTAGNSVQTKKMVLLK